MKTGIILTTLLLSSVSWAQGIKWITIDEALKQNKAKPKKIIIDVYTDWCGWCKRMDKDTYANSVIVKYINDNYYAVKFNAEQRGPVSFKNKIYNFQAQGGRGVHEFAYMLLNGQMGYPSTAFINTDLQVIGAVSGYKDPDNMDILLRYIKEEKYKTGVTLQQYETDINTEKQNKIAVPPTP
jgi:thioredoxin-related protein